MSKLYFNSNSNSKIYAKKVSLPIYFMNLFKNCFQIFSLLLRSTFSSEQGFSGCVGMIKDHQNNSEKYCVKLHRNKKKRTITTKNVF